MIDTNDLNDRQQNVVSTYLQITSETKTRPVYSDFLQYGISRDTLRTTFGGIEKLHRFMDENYHSELSTVFATLGEIFSPHRAATQISSNTYIITTAVADCSPHINFLKSLDTYSKINGAQIIIMPCESITNSFENKTAVFDPIFNDPKYAFVSSDTQLNNNISLCSVQVSAKQIRPITGLSRIGNRDGSFVFASTKQFLEFVPSGNNRGVNYSIMTTGACTLPQYYTNTFVSKRLSYIAEKDHMIGAIIIEIQDQAVFHFRQIQADENGCFIDLGIQYNPDDTTHKVEANLVMGDLHSAHVDEDALNATLKLASTMDINAVFLHDVFDGHSVNHHETTITARALRETQKKHILREELQNTYKVIDYIDKHLTPKEIVVVKSNHDEFLTRYLREGRYVSDPTNHYLSLKIATALFEDCDVLKRGFEIVECPTPDHWKFLDRSASYKISGVECGAHGDLGLNGAKPSLATLEKVYSDCVVAHSHTAAIHRGVFRVGTLSVMDMGYNKGPSSWTHTSCLIYSNGQRQLINVINGRCSTRV